MKEQLIYLGCTAGAHGIKGAVKLKLENESSSSLKKGSTLYTSNDSTSKTFVIERIQFGNKVICYLEGVDNRNQIEDFLPFEIYIKRDSLPQSTHNDIYLCDLIGFNVVDEKGRGFGEVESFFDHGAGDIIVIKKNNETIELPFVDAFFPVIDLENKQLKINYEGEF